MIVQVLKDQIEELRETLNIKKLVKRETENKFKNILNSKLVKVVTGIRRCGKSVLIYTLLKDKEFAYINFDDERLIKCKPEEVLPAFYEAYGKFKLIFLDEIQNLDNWELFVNRLHRSGFNVVITGSNAKLLSKELATHLTGRHLALELFPFSFREYLEAIGHPTKAETTKDIGILKHELKKYIDSGGFPEVVVDKEIPGIYLRELYRKIIERDIVDRYNISYKKTFREIAITVLSHPGRGISYNRMKNQFQLGSDHTVKNYISYLEEAYLIFLVNKFSRKPVEVQKSEKKIYAIDTGLINSVSLKTTEDYGRLYENTVALELLRKKSGNSSLEIYYWKDSEGHEVDFLIKEDLEIKKLIQVCYNIDNIKTKKRELRGLLSAMKEFGLKTGLIITKDLEKTEKIKGKSIKYIPLWKYLLNI